MKKNNRKTPMGARLVSFVLVMAMIFTLTACGTNNNNEGAGIGTESNPTIAPLDNPDEPNVDIDPGADIEVDPTTEVTEPTTTVEAPSGMYTYTLYGETISMNVNIDDYLGTNSAGTQVFYLPRLIFDLGWCAGNYTSIEEVGSNSFPSRWWFYADNNLTIMINGSKYDDRQFGALDVEYLINGSNFERYYSDDSLLHMPYYCTISRHLDSCVYTAAGTSWKMTYEDVLFVAYILWSESVNPGNNAVVATFGEDFSNLGHSDGQYRCILP
ncbi:MAG: hypothetical protein MJ154_02215 [Candidatus Saccharibacteria bacterium]|nr:hypothetical protein [Candidatus Saccharibacteria bacterium]